MAASLTACFNLLYFHMHTQGLSAMLKAPQLQRAAELAKSYKRIGKYFASEYPVSSKLVQTVIQSQSCFSIVVLGPQEKSCWERKCVCVLGRYVSYL